MDDLLPADDCSLGCVLHFVPDLMGLIVGLIIYFEKKLRSDSNSYLLRFNYGLYG